MWPCRLYAVVRIRRGGRGRGRVHAPPRAARWTQQGSDPTWDQAHERTAASPRGRAGPATAARAHDNTPRALGRGAGRLLLGLEQVGRSGASDDDTCMQLSAVKVSIND